MVLYIYNVQCICHVCIYIYPAQRYRKRASGHGDMSRERKVPRGDDRADDDDAGGTPDSSEES